MLSVWESAPPQAFRFLSRKPVAYVRCFALIADFAHLCAGRPLHTHAFETDEHADGAEARLTQHLRSVVSRSLPDLEFVALKGGELCGYALLSRTSVRLSGGPLEAVLLAPLCVAQPVRRTGVGTALVRRALSDAAQRGERLALVLGDPAYYARFGFEPFATAGLTVAARTRRPCAR